MSKVRRAVFLERSSYRRRRARDASRLLPVLGLVVFFVPGLWDGNEEGKILLSDAMLFLFLAWIVAIAIAAFLSRYLSEAVVGEAVYPEDISVE